VTVSGTLTVRDRSRPLSFPAAVTLAADGTVILDATVQADRSQFGLTVNPMGMSFLNSAVTIHAVFTRS
jgi:polyisoprenoid-binding protein YceI